MSISRLTALSSIGDPPEVLARLESGCIDIPEVFGARSAVSAVVISHWKKALYAADPTKALQKYTDAGCSVSTPGCEDYPRRLLHDPYRPEVLIAKGDLSLCNKPTVALVGTRRCTPSGRATAERFGSELANRGVGVVSGLALGIDAAAHRGALAAGKKALPIAVVGSGFDHIYPPRNAALWNEVCRRGVVLSETPNHLGPEPWRFPARNRIIAALADVVVVVESHGRGGSLSTVGEAAERGIDVMAVPGSINSSASEGTNAMLRDGAAPACSVDDILMTLEARTRASDFGGSRIDGVRAGDPPGAHRETHSAATQLGLALDADHQRLLETVTAEGISSDSLLLHSGLTRPGLARALVDLQAAGWAQERDGLWFRVR